MDYVYVTLYTVALATPVVLTMHNLSRGDRRG